MKKSILTLIAFIAIIGSVQAQTKPVAEKDPTSVNQAKPAPAEVFKAEISAEQKEAILNLLNAAKNTILRSSNSNTTEQNVNLINEMQALMNMINEKFQKDAEPEVKVKPKN